MKIISWNVNGIRAVHNKGFVEWITQESPDILCLQETKAEMSQFPQAVVEHEHYKCFSSSAEKKGYSGVATLSREKFLDTKKMENQDYDSEGRILIHETENFYLLNCYFPNSQRDHKRLPYKLKFLEDILKKMNALKTKKGVIITGDFNIAHKEIDLANPKTNTKNAGFLPEERAWMDRLMKEGWVDIYRHLNPDKEGAYTWWSQMNPNIRERNIGWRLDYFVISPDLVARVEEASILSAVKGSDHCPVKLVLRS
jgi:exodeoxyribonuclease-3